MKNRIITISAILGVVLFFSSCSEDVCESTITYVGYEPVYRTLEELTEEIKFVPERKLEVPGKIYYYGSYLLISEHGTGVHVIDNSDPATPETLGFIEIAGNVDIAFVDHYIYADTYHNIIVVDIQDLNNPKVVGAINDVKEWGWQLDRGLMVVDYVETTMTTTVDCNQNLGQDVFFDATSNVLFVNSSNVDQGFQRQAESVAGGAPGTGQGGSLARMALFDGHFYYVNDHAMHIYDVSDLTTPVKVSDAYMEWGVETIFPYKDNLFIGANNGMHIYDNQDPTNPRYLSTFAHANACDPVVVQDDIAYITLRDGNECQDFVNQLDVVDVSDLLKPQLIATFPMYNPHGLAVRGESLYLCEGDQGLKIYDISEVEEIGQNQIGGIGDYHAYDVISVSSQLLMMVGKDGFFQFDTNEPSQPRLLSSIAVN